MATLAMTSRFDPAQKETASSAAMASAWQYMRTDGKHESGPVGVRRLDGSMLCVNCVQWARRRCGLDLAHWGVEPSKAPRERVRKGRVDSGRHSSRHKVSFLRCYPYMGRRLLCATCGRKEAGSQL